MKKLLEDEKAQGATEYLLILAGVLGVVAMAISYIIELANKAEAAAESNADKVFENL